MMFDIIKYALCAGLLLASPAFSQSGQTGSQIGTQNYIINGDITFNQRGPATAIVDGVYFVDRFQYGRTGTMVHNANQSSDVPSLAQSGHVSQYSAALTMTTPDTSIATSDYTVVNYRLEGVNWAQIAGKPFTLSFWVKATATGVYSIAFRNGALNFSYVSTYTVNASDTWEKKIVTVPAPTGGTWSYDSTTGLIITWGLAFGSTWQTSTLNAWQSGNYGASTTQVNGVNTGATNFKLAQVMLNTGKGAAPFALAGGDVQGELAKAQRYYEKSYEMGVAPGTNLGSETGGASLIASAATSLNGGLAGNHIAFKVTKRTTPVVTYYRGTGTSGQAWCSVDKAPGSAATISDYTLSPNYASWTIVPGASSVISFCIFAYTASAEL